MRDVDHRSARERLVRYRADPQLPREEAAARISAYVYGNILVFAALVPLGDEEVHHGHAALLVLGVAASTLLAHVFAELMGRTVRAGEPMTRTELWHECRDAMPILTSGTVPCLLLGAGALHWLSPAVAIAASQVYLLVRMALFGLLVERLNSTRPTLRTLLVGVLTALVAAAIATLKATIGH